jgi:protease-4
LSSNENFSSSQRGYRSHLHPLALLLMVSFTFFCLMLSLGAIFAVGRLGSLSWFKDAPAAPLVGVVELTGAISDSKNILARLEKAAEDSTIGAVVLRLNSPGGSVAPSQEIYDAVVDFKKPLVVSMGSVAASGAFYIACGAKHVFANPGTITGSIGVIMEFANLEGLYDWAKVKRYSIKTGKFKDAGAEYRDLTEEERNLFTQMVMNVLDQFKHAIMTGRNLPAQAVDAIADGRVFSGAQAKQLGLVDQLGGYMDAVTQAGKLAGIQGKPKVVVIGKSRKFWLDLLVDDPSKQDDNSGSFVDQLFARFGKSSLVRPAGAYLIMPGA